MAAPSDTPTAFPSLRPTESPATAGKRITGSDDGGGTT